MDKLIINKYPELLVMGAIIEGVAVTLDIPDFLSEFENKITRKYDISAIPEDPIIREYRKFFWSIGIDPTKERPSSEALIRRILRGKGLYRINNIVDTMNIISAYTGIVMSVFDLDKISLPVHLRAAEGTEKMRIIGGKEITIPEGFPILTDNNNRVFSATVYRDGEHAKVTQSTSNILLVMYAPRTIDRTYVASSLKMVVEHIVRAAGGTIVQKQV